MDYKELVLKSLRLVWGNKWLWAFGLFASAGGGSGSYNFSGGGNMQPFSENPQDFNWQVFGSPVSDWVSRNLILLIALAVIVFLLIIMVAIFGIVSQAALIGAADKLDEDEETGFSQSLSTGITNFWRLLGLMILLALIIIVPLLFMVAIGLMVYASGMPMFFLVFLIPVILIMIPVAIGVSLVGLLGSRSVVIDSLGPVDAIKSGWKMLRENLGPVLLTWLISLLIGFVVGIVVVILLLMLVVPIAMLGYLIFLTGITTAKLAGIAVLALLFFLIFLVLRSALGAYRSVYWTLAFRQIRALNEPEAPE
ncbi:MAG TPA: hypothetical protein ENI11_04555 [Actinobacteria bacterium]|nr:hypothetical protein [Actinomycetota bacterium]